VATLANSFQGRQLRRGGRGIEGGGSPIRRSVGRTDGSGGNSSMVGITGRTSSKPTTEENSGARESSRRCRRRRRPPVTPATSARERARERECERTDCANMVTASSPSAGARRPFATGTSASQVRRATPRSTLLSWTKQEDGPLDRTFLTQQWPRLRELVTQPRVRNNSWPARTTSDLCSTSLRDPRPRTPYVIPPLAWRLRAHEWRRLEAPGGGEEGVNEGALQPRRMLPPSTDVLDVGETEGPPGAEPCVIREESHF
jgi:hypothetical protein